jgi:copper chaperone
MNTTTETIGIEGMSCGHCVQAVKRALEGTGGVEVHEVAIGSACVSYDPNDGARAAIAEAIEEAGFTVKGRG